MSKISLYSIIFIMGTQYSVYCMNDHQKLQSFETYYRNTLVPQLCKKRKIFEPTIVYPTLKWRLKTKNTDHIDGIDNQTTSNNATFLLQPEHTLKETQYIFNNNPITIAITVISSPEIPIISPPKNNTATPLQYRAAFLKPSLSIPIDQGRLQLGIWQQIVLLDFDNRPRQRRIRGQVLGLQPATG